MREIKFQSIHEHYDTKEVVFSEWGPQGLGSFSGPSSISGYKLIGHRQFTGLKDKNGVEIYESDVFHMGDPNILYVVEWFDTGFQGRQITNKSRVGLLHWRDRINVTTNIYQNPELLNTKP